MTAAEAKAEREERNNRDNVRAQAQAGTEEQLELPSTGKKKKQKASARSAPLEGKQDKTEDANTAQEPEASKATVRKAPKRKLDTLKPPEEDEFDEHLESSKKKPKLKAKPAKADQTGTAPTRRSTRNKDVHEPTGEEQDDEKGSEEAYDKPSSSAKGRKRQKGAAAVTTVSKKAKTKK